MIYYFSATGNSNYTARRLVERLNEKMTFVTVVLQKDILILSGERMILVATCGKNSGRSAILIIDQFCCIGFRKNGKYGDLSLHNLDRLSFPQRIRHCFSAYFPYNEYGKKITGGEK